MKNLNDLSFKSVMGSDDFSYAYPSSDLIISCSNDFYVREHTYDVLKRVAEERLFDSYLDSDLSDEEKRRKFVEQELDIIQSQSLSLY